jgi:2-oxo-3-hexenedioate decarboxylase
MERKNSILDRSNPHARKLVQQLLNAKEQVETIELPSNYLEQFDLDAAYQVGHQLQKKLESHGLRPSGRKIGFTNRDTWEEFRLNTSIWAPMYDQTVAFANHIGGLLSLDSMVAPRIEPEVVFRLKESVTYAELASEPNQILDAIAWVAIGFEIVDCHYPDWKFTAADAVADFGFHGMLVIGEPKEVMKSQYQIIEAQLRAFEVILKKGDEAVASGRGENALGSPLHALGHLVEILDGQPWAPPLEAGEIITTGTLTSLPYIYPGERWRVEPIGIGLSPLQLTLT